MTDAAPLLAVVGDDLSGVVAVSGEFAAKGLATVLPRSAEGLGLDILSPLFGEPSRSHVGRVIAVTTDSRHDPPAVAREKVRAAARALSEMGAALLIKKVDSLLRGNIGPELAAAMEGSGSEKAFCVFAAPSHGRTTVGGEQLVNGEPVGRDDPGSYVRFGSQGSSIVELLRKNFGNRVRSLSLDVVRQGRSAVHDEVERMLSADLADVVVCDSATAKHLADCVSVAISSGFRLLVGTSDLCDGVAEALVNSGRMSPKPPVLIISGTASQVGRDQLANVAAKDLVQLIEVSTDVLGMHPTSSARAAASPRSGEVERYVRRASALLNAGWNVLVCSEAPPELGVEASRAVVRALTEVGAGAIREARVCGVVATGGETAEALLDLLRVEGLAIGRDVIPGVPEAIVLGGPHAGLRYVAKTGAYGGPDALEEIVGWLASCNELFDTCVGGIHPLLMAHTTTQEED